MFEYFCFEGKKMSQINVKRKNKLICPMYQT